MDEFTCRHFALASPRGSSTADLPLLLRRVADEIERRAIDPMEILDLTLSDEITADGPWWSMTLYWSPESDGERGDADEGESVNETIRDALAEDIEKRRSAPKFKDRVRQIIEEDRALLERLAK